MVSRTKPSQIAKGSKPQRRAYQTFTSRAKRNSRHRRLSRRYLLVALILSLIIVACTNTSKSYPPAIAESPLASTALTIWWDKGFTVEEDEALQKLVSRWEQQTGNRVKLSFYTTDELPQKAQRAIQAGHPPDILTSHSAERVLIPRLGWEGKLVDVSDIVNPVKSLYSETVLSGVYLYNNIAKKRSYYAIPVSQGTTLIFYWRDLLKLAGRSDKDIPKNWDAFWQFWEQVQDILRTQHNMKIYGLGFPMSSGAGDTYQTFEHILEAYNIEILDSQGQLQVDAPKVRQGIIDSLDWYTKFYKQGYVPQDAVNWLNPDNNRSLLNRLVVMTPNNSLSITAAVRQDPDTYRNLSTLEFPKKPNGKSMRHIVTIRSAVIFTQSKNQKLAKDFLAYLSKPKVTAEYLKAAGGQNLPVQKSDLLGSFSDPADPHISTATKVVIEGQTRLFYIVQNPAYSFVLKENIWGKALSKVVVDGISPEQAADEAIERIKQIFNQWQ